MVVETLSEVLLGIYLGLLAGIIPAFIAFGIGFGFKYFTDVTVPGLGVVVLGGALAGISGGLMGLMDPELAQNWTGITAVLVILMAALWAHSQGDKLAAATPRKLTLRALRKNKLSVDLAERVDSYGQIRLRPIGEIQNIEGYPPLSDDVRTNLREGSWKFPASLSLAELEEKLEDKLLTDYELAEVAVSVDRKGRVEIAAAPTIAGLSRRVPKGRRAVSVKTLLPKGIARGDIVSLRLPDGPVTGPVVSARTDESEPPTATVAAAVPEDDTADETDTDEPPSQPSAPTTTGGEGRVTVALPLEAARRTLRTEFSPIVVHSRGKQREYEAIGVLKSQGNRFRKYTLGEGSQLVDTTIGSHQIRAQYEVAILAIRRASERIVAPRGDVTLRAGDSLIVVGLPERLDAFEGVVS